jgi:hypothetical protein
MTAQYRKPTNLKPTWSGLRSEREAVRFFTGRDVAPLYGQTPEQYRADLAKAAGGAL